MINDHILINEIKQAFEVMRDCGNNILISIALIVYNMANSQQSAKAVLGKKNVILWLVLSATTTEIKSNSSDL